MRRFTLPTILIIAVGLGLSTLAAEAAIRGEYVEVRTADVYTGPCFANAEVNLVGKEAILAWHVTEGEWQGVPLEGLKVVAVVEADTTLGDPHASPSAVRSMVLLDRQATVDQQEALLDFARSMGGDVLGDILEVRVEGIDMRVAGSEASVRAGGVAELRTRSLHAGDIHCGNEEVYYPPLTDTPDAIPAYTEAHVFRGQGLSSTWSSPAKRSAFVGTFDR